MSSQMIGKYTLTAAIAKSAHGAVYRGTDPSGRAVAIKMIQRNLVTTASLSSYRKHCTAFARIDHPDIARFIELIDTEKAVCLVGEFCEGKALSALLTDGAHPELKNAWEISRQMLEALAFAHVKGVIHRDLKPSNLILAGDGRLKITDFGVALLRTGPPEIVHYHAPEQFDDSPVTPRTDLYQAGAIIYQLVTGKLPFTGTPEEIAHRVSQERPSDPSSYNNRLAWQLDWVIQKALGKDPGERFGTATEFAEGLRLGLQDTIGRPLETLSATASAVPVPLPAPAAPAPAAPAVTSKPAAPPPDLAKKAQVLAAAKAKAAPASSAPAANPGSSATSPAAASAKEPAKPRVLFVDDDERILNGLAALFRPDYHVLTAGNGEDALDLVKRMGPQVVVSDQRMPGMTGVEVLRKVRTLAPNAVRILLTGYADLAALVGSINEGEIFRFVGKPWDNDDLRKALVDALAFARDHQGGTPARAASPRSAGSLLVIDPQQGLARGLERLLAGEATVTQVTTPAEAAEVLKTQRIAAIVADLGAGMDGLVALFKQIKLKRPEILTILLADEPDSELGIELINKAQIFRFLPKPVSAKELRTQVAAALRRYAATQEAAAKGAPSANAAAA